MSVPQQHKTDDTSLSLIERIRQQDDSAWRRLVDLYGPLVKTWCRKSGLNDSDAADVLQNVLSAVLRNISGFRRNGPGDTFRGWLRVISRNEIRAHFRRAEKSPIGVGGTSMLARIQSLPDEQAEDCAPDDAEEQTSLYRRALDLMRSEFEESTWRAFVETAINGRPTADVAAELQISAGAVRQARYRVLRRLRTEFSDFLD